MTDVLTQAKGLIQQTVGGNDDAWGDILNGTIGLIDQALGGTIIKSLTGNIILTSAETQNTGYHFIGTLATTATVTFPSFYGLCVVRNDTNGSVSCGIAGGASVSIATGSTRAFWADGTDFVALSPGTPYFDLTAIPAPATPPTGHFYLYMDVADNKLKSKGPNGTVTILANP